MASPLNDKRIVLGVTGSISCYKSVDLASKLVQVGAKVDVLMTQEATKFITPLTFSSITHRNVMTDMYEPTTSGNINHVSVAEQADILVIAPATAHIIAKLAHGLADDPITLTALATQSPVIIAPAMDGAMYENQATQQNINLLKERGYYFVGPDSGRLASGLIGQGRLTDISDLQGAICQILGNKGDLKDTKIVVSAGGTKENIDPVRVISNNSTGKMGFATAEAARDRGAKVVLVSAPTSLPVPYGITFVSAPTAYDMETELIKECESADVLIMAAAISDWKPKEYSADKIKKSKSDSWNLELVKNSDILQKIKGTKLLKIGFAAESDSLISNASKKLKLKNLEFIVANDISRNDSGFGTDTNRVTFVTKSGATEQLPLLSKYEVGHAILDKVAMLLRDTELSSQNMGENNADS